MSSSHHSSSPLPERLELTGKDVHFWSVPLVCGEASLVSLLTWLSPDECARADQYQFAVHRRRFIVRRASLRAVLAAYGNVSACDVCFQVDRYDKPELPTSFPGGPLYFNLSHSDELALIAVSRSGPLGVDIERVRPLPDLETVAAQFFAPAEHQEILRLPAEQQLLAFYRCWTSKEAFIKALGLGLHFDLNRFEVSVSPSEPPALLCIDNDPQKARLWCMTDVACREEYLGALVSARPPGELLYHHWNPSSDAM